MEKISTYAFPGSTATLRSAFGAGRTPEEMLEPLQALVQRIAGMSAQNPASMYLFSTDESSELRNLFGYVLALAMLQHVPSTLLVDCDFLDIGMSGVVPQKDALGFLDFLLYGSSLGVITQETAGGVHVVGAGSFPVTKKMPFALTAFEEASRRLINHCRFAVYNGPLYDDEGNPHPLIGAVDLPVIVRAASVGPGVVDPVDEEIASQHDVELISVRIDPQTGPRPTLVDVPVDETVVAEPPAAAPPPLEDVAPEAPIEVTDEEPEPVAEPAASTKQEPEPPVVPKPRPQPRPVDQPASAPLDYEERRYSSLFPKIATWGLGIVIVAFIVWWFWAERPKGGGEGGVAENTAVAVDTTAQRPVVDEPPDTTALPVQPGTETAAGESETPVEPTTPAPEATAPPETTSTAAVFSPDDIFVMDDLVERCPGAYLIHISSFRESAKAHTEVSNLERRGFPVFIVFLNLGSKGSWYRVYAGPLDTREQARDMKNLLDDTPGVSFTRITRAPQSG